MVKTNTTISLDSEVKRKIKDIIKEKGYNFSWFIESLLLEYIRNNERRNNNVWTKKEN